MKRFLFIFSLLFWASTAWATGSVWQVACTTQPNLVYFNGVLGTPVASALAVTAQYDWYWASNVLFVWSPSGSGPNTDYTNPGIEAGARARAMTVNNQSYITVNGIAFRDNNTVQSDVIYTGFTTLVGVTISNCVIERGIGYGIELGGSSTATSATINNNIIRNNGAAGIIIDYDLTSGSIFGNTIHDNGWRGILDSTYYSGINGKLGNLNTYNNTIYSNGANCKDSTSCHGIYHIAGETLTANIYNNTCYNHPNGFGIKLNSPANAYNNTLYGNSGGGIYTGGNTTDTSIAITYNLIYSNGPAAGSSGIGEYSKGADTLSLSIENNTLCQNSGTGQNEILINDNLTALTIKNNIINATSSRYTIHSVTQSAATINNNLHYGPSGNPVYYNGNGISWATWQGDGFDTAGINADPLFTNGSGSYSLVTDFTLQPGSPAIRAGTPLGLQTDYAGGTVHEPPSIGAYEYEFGVLSTFSFSTSGQGVKSTVHGMNLE